MSAKETLSKIAGMLNVNLAEEVALESAKLENGAVLEAEKFEAGESVFIATEDEKVAVPIGEYKMEDGRSLIVEEEGLIASILEAGEDKEEEEVEVEAAEEEEKEEKEEMAYATKEELGAAMDELKNMIEEVKQMVSPKEEKEDMSAEEEVVEETKEELSAQEPAAKPIKSNPEAKAKKGMMTFGTSRGQSTLDRVFSKMSR